MTVLIPTFNREAWLAKSIESVLSQTYRDYCVLVCDNDSEDGTESTVRAFGDDRILYEKRPENIGMLGNHIEAMRSVQTEYFTILGDDNLADPEHLQISVDLLDRNDTIGMVHSAYDIIDDDGVTRQEHASMAGRDVKPFETGEEFVLKSLRARIRACEATTVFRTRAVREAGYYDTEDTPLHDVGLFLRIGAAWNVAYVDRPLVRFRIHGDALGLQAVRSSRDALTDPDGFPNRNLAVKTRFIRGHAPDRRTARRWASIARASRRRIMLEWVGAITRPARPRRQTVELLRAAAAVDSRVYLEPRAWGLLAMSLGGKRFAALASDLRRRAGAER